MDELEQEEQAESTQSGSTLREKLEGTLGENAQLREKLAFTEAGMDPNSDEAKFVLRNMGDLDMNAENVTQTLESLRAAFAPASDTATEPSSEETQDPPADRDQAVAAQETRADLTGGAGKLPDPPEEDIVEGSFAQRRKLLEGGTQTADANSLVSHAIFADALSKGNQSTRVWEGWEAHKEKEAAKR